MEKQESIETVKHFFRAADAMRGTIRESVAAFNRVDTLQDLINLANSPLAPDSITEKFKQESAPFLALELNGQDDAVSLSLAKESLEDDIFPALDLACYDWRQIGLRGRDFVSAVNVIMSDMENFSQAMRTITDAYFTVDEEISYYVIPNTAFLMQELSVK